MNKPVHIELSFNNKVMSVVDTVDQCHKRATFWTTPECIDKIDIYCTLNGYDKIDSKEKFGVLIASELVKIRG